MPYLDGPRPRLFAHRGGSLVAPENTIEAFAAGLAAGATHLELDVHATRDGHVVVMHDELVDRTTDGRGRVRDLTLAELRKLDAGSRFVARDGAASFAGRGLRVPLLTEVLEAFEGARLNVEIKQREPGIVADVVGLLEHAGAMGRTLLAAEDPAIMADIRARAPGALTGFSAADVVEFLQGESGKHYLPPGRALQVPPSFGGVTIVSTETVARAHALGVEVHVWTLNTAAEIEAMLALGVDGVMTDDPAMAAAVLGPRWSAPSLGHSSHG